MILWTRLDRIRSLRGFHRYTKSLLRFISRKLYSSSTSLPVTNTPSPPTVSTSVIETSPLLASLIDLCRSCGVPLQDLAPSKPGYFCKPSVKPDARRNQEDIVYEEHLKKLDPETAALLLNDLPQTSGNVALPFLEFKKLHREHARGGPIVAKRLDAAISEQKECLRCRDALFRSSFAPSQFEQWLLIRVLNLIPIRLNIVLVVSAIDFPLGVDERIFLRRVSSQNDIIVVVNKLDLWFRSVNLAQKYGRTFCQDYFNSKYSVPRENVHVVSAKLDWNMDALLDAIPTDLYVIGSVNSGKLTILNSLLFKCFQKKMTKWGDHRNRNEVREQQKAQDTLISSHLLELLLLVLMLKRRKKTNSVATIFRSKVGPGTLYFPGFTRGHIPLELGNDKSVYDVPGFTRFELPTNAPHGLFSAVTNPRALKNASAGNAVFKYGEHKSKYETIRPGQCIMLGGLVYVAFPTTTATTTKLSSMYQVRNCINITSHTFLSDVKAFQVSAKVRENWPSLAPKYLVEHSSETRWNRFVIPPFYGTIDLVIQHLGHINIKPTGAFHPEAQLRPIVVYLPPGVQAIVRQPITKYIAKSFTGRDRNGNPLRKEKIPTLSTLALHRYANKYPFYTRLIPSNDIADEHATNQAEKKRLERDTKRIYEWMISKGNVVDPMLVDLLQNATEFWAE